MKKPKISVIITAYNVGKYIEEAIKSVLSQTFKDYEIIVVDDGSTDNTKDVVMKYKDKLSYYYKENGGLASVRNYGIKKAKTDIIAFLDGDDVWYPERLESCYRKIIEYPDAMMVYSTFTLIKINGDIIINKVDLPKIRDYYPRILLGNIINFQGALVKKESFKKCGLISDGLEMYADWDFFIRLSRRYKIIYIDQPLFYYRSTKHYKLAPKRINYKVIRQLILLKRAFNCDQNLSYHFKLHCISNVYFDMAKFCFFRKQFIQTIKLNVISIVYMPLQVKAYLFFPHSIIKRMLKIINGLT